MAHQWHKVDDSEIKELYLEDEGELSGNMLCMVEYYAADHNRFNKRQPRLIESEEELSSIFDEDIMPAVIDQYGSDDQCAIDQAFNDWTDALCKGGELHREQYNHYCNVGKRG